MIDNTFKALVNIALVVSVLFLFWKGIDALFTAIHNIGSM